MGSKEPTSSSPNPPYSAVEYVDVDAPPDTRGRATGWGCTASCVPATWMYAPPAPVASVLQAEEATGQ